jgi:hypothetical protein
MKKVFSLSVIIMAALLISCSSQKITSSYINQDAQAKGPFNKICVIALVPNTTQKIAVENKMAELIKSRGTNAVESSTILPMQIANEVISREELVEKLKAESCDAVLTISELDVRTEERYVPGAAPMPLPPYRYRYYNNYYSYYSYRYNQIYEPGYVTRQTTYFFENNFYDLESGELLWSIQSSAFEPSDIDSWFEEYSSLIIKELKKEDLLK